MPAYRPAEERWHEKVNKTGACWTWTAYVDRRGYGIFWAGGDRGNTKAHRFAYELFVGPIPEDLLIDHLCRNRSCVRPEHLEPVTSRENTLRGDTLAASNITKTHCSAGHPYDAGNTYMNRGARFCRMCGRRHAAEHRARKRAA